eukprot:11676201-Alexandrium_andersonii.AAC.1
MASRTRTKGLAPASREAWRLRLKDGATMTASKTQLRCSSLFFWPPGASNCIRGERGRQLRTACRRGACRGAF